MSEAFPTLDEDIAAFEKKMSDDFDISIGQIKAAERALSDLRGMGFPSTHQSIYNLFTRLRSNERMARDAELAALKREAAALELLDAARKAIAKARPYFSNGSAVAKALDAVNTEGAARE